jgi:hypothetical protein
MPRGINVAVTRKDINRVVFHICWPISILAIRPLPPFIDLFLSVVNCHFEIKDSGPEGHADYETDAMPSSTIVEDGDES